MDTANQHSIYHVVIEPFYGGSHKQLLNGLLSTDLFPTENTLLLTLPAKKWKWYAIITALVWCILGRGTDFVLLGDSDRLRFISALWCP